ncbi:GntR family transcriptional regulator [Steroidobacter agaridevorans]|uniref:GntR family transcriptional regulator n=1 Tax=Steroidobacter agaridevorans TaxID=2695856 RepID=A0A829Y870_9GAMM|nr:MULTISPECIES: GntR family transcriptional regulator [Steroidobacteraceae]GFE79233.1 GntR family transcriptional regulator [Steroidobacter agaridevorans]GFE87275.1 GntR family transcriptional regulator [Steroidobacter agaridevorans]
MKTNGAVIVQVREQIAERLRLDIISGALAPNQKITEEALAQRFGVSRGRIRDVLLELSKEGLIVNRANRGSTVNNVPSTDLQALMIKLRLAIETFAIRQAIRARPTQLLDDLTAAFKDLSERLEAGDFAEVTHADIAFHRVIVMAAGGEDLVNLWQPIVLRMRMNYKRISTPKQAIAEHKKILDAIRKADASAAVAALEANIR